MSRLPRRNDCDVDFGVRFFERQRRQVLKLWFDGDFDDNAGDSRHFDEVKFNLELVARSDAFREINSDMFPPIIRSIENLDGYEFRESRNGGKVARLKIQEASDRKVHERLGELIALGQIFHNQIGERITD